MKNFLRLMLLTIISMVSGSVAYAANTVTWDASSKNPMPAFDVIAI